MEEQPSPQGPIDTSASASVTDAVLSRRSVRGFLEKPVDSAVLRRILSLTARAPSGCNLQPWHFHVVTGNALSRFKDMMRTRAVEAPRGEPTEYDILPAEMPAIYHDRRFEVGFGLYDQLGIAREDKDGRAQWSAFNLQFFGAPVGLFCSIDRRMGPPQWADMGMALQTLMLLLREAGLHSCPQEAWSLYSRTVGGFLGLAPEWMLFCGMAIGYADPDAAANGFVAGRAQLQDYATFIED